MSVPGSNILAQALSAIGTSEFIFYKWISKSTNAARKTVHVYDPGVAIRGSIQAVERSKYKSMGLNFSSKYLAIWTVQDVEVLSRLQPNDQIGFLGRRFNILSEDDWIPMDFWNNFVAIDIGADAGDP